MGRMNRRRLSPSEFDVETFNKNEVTANKSLSIAALFLAGFLILIWLLVLVLSSTKIISLSNKLIYFSFPIVAAFLAIPIIFYKRKEIEKPGFKYLLIVLYLVAMASINIVEPIHSILGFAIIILVSCHYYSRKVLNLAFAVTIFLIFICLYMGLFFGDWDANLVGISELSAPSFLGIAKEEFHDSPQIRWQVMKKIYEEEGVNRYLNLFINYFITRAGATTILYFIALQLSGRTYLMLESVSQNVKSKEKMDGELSLAQGIQLNFIPTDFPNTDEYQIFGMIRSAKEVGGDYYDYFLNKKSEVVFNIGDVSGKGIPGSLTMMRAKTLMKSFAISNRDMSDVLDETNKELCLKNDRNVFVTSIIGKLNLDSGEVILSNAGHNPPIIKRNGTFEYLKLHKGFVLGGFDQSIYKNSRFQLLPDDMIILYTDGVTEAMNIDDEMYGEERLLNCLNAHKDLGLEELFSELRKDIRAFRGDAIQNDDITVLGVLYKGEKTMKREITVDTLPENIEVLTEFVNSFINKYSDNERAIAQINVAIDELFSNIVKFAYRPEIGKAILRIELRKEPVVSIRITFIDKGKPFNPLEILSPDVNLDLDERKVGGLGIFIVKRTMDEVTYEYKDGQNILSIKKRL